jgi:hypothetical protein
MSGSFSGFGVDLFFLVFFSLVSTPSSFMFEINVLEYILITILLFIPFTRIYNYCI